LMWIYDASMKPENARMMMLSSMILAGIVYMDYLHSGLVILVERFTTVPLLSTQ
jgi:hypothetical protein